MHLLDIVYNKYYLPTVINRERAKRQNRNTDFTLFCANCMGGYIYHQLGVEFKSPTINMMIMQPDFYKLVANIEQYMKMDFVEVRNGSRVPCGRLGDITVYFTHYNTFEDGVRSWKERSQRINMDNLYIIATDRDGVSCEDIAALQKIKCKKLLVFTAKKMNFPYCFWLPQYEQQGMVGNIIKKTLSGKWLFETFFDYVGWLNSEDDFAEHFRVE